MDKRTKTVKVPKELAERGDLVLIPQKEYEGFLEWRKETRDALAKVRRGKKAYKEGRTIVADSPKEIKLFSTM